MAYPFVPAYAQYGRRKGPVKAFLVHVAEGGGTVGFLSRDNARGVSVHYVIEYTGRIVQMVRESDATGSVNPRDIRTTDDADGFYGATTAKAVMDEWWSDPNSAVISVEIEGFALDGPNQRQQDALAALVADVRSRFPSMGLLGHRDFADYKRCPGRLIPWDRLGGHGEVSDVPGLTLTNVVPFAGTATIKGSGHGALQVDNGAFVPLPDGTAKPVAFKAKLVPPHPGHPSGICYGIGDELAIFLAEDAVVVAAPDRYQQGKTDGIAIGREQYRSETQAYLDGNP